MLPTQVLYYGSEQALPEKHLLHAGPLSLIYMQGELRYITYKGREVLRRVYVAVRDHNWGTVPPRLSHEQIDDRGDSFDIRFTVQHLQPENNIDFTWQGTLSGKPDGTLLFAMDGSANTTFLRNRIGFCILHPVRECAGQPCRVETADGNVKESIFPYYISPENPFKLMAAISHQFEPDAWAHLRFTGDEFEMEDQRNWTDGSYKTFCTPLALPFPVEVQAGTRIRQTVTLTLEGASAQAETAETAPVRLVVSPDTASRSQSTLPHIGLGVASDSQPLTDSELERLRTLRLHHLRIDLTPADQTCEAQFKQAHREAEALGIPLEIALHLSGSVDTELQRVANMVQQIQPQVFAWLIFRNGTPVTPESALEAARRVLATATPGALFGGGTNAYFTQLNRNRPNMQALDIVCYSINPQVHAFDNESLVETLELQGATVDSARQFAGETPVVVSPVTMKPRFNPDATVPASEPPAGVLPWEVDVRQMSLFGAGWTLGSYKHLAENRAFSVTYYETSGWRGVMERQTGSRLPELFHSMPGTVYPLYHVLADIGEFNGGFLTPVSSDAPLRAEALLLHREGATRLMVASFSNESQQVEIEGISGTVRILYLDETNVEAAMREPETFRSQSGQVERITGRIFRIMLQPYSVVRIDIAADGLE